MNNNISEQKEKYNLAFQKALSQLNTAQRQAVEQIEGAVLVVAGPGTGKTQLLAARIGYILEQTDTNSSNILCLTFTDAGAVAMRQRLIQFIGPEAYNVSIYTFHAFCNKVIGENIEFFGGYYDLQAVSELEKVGFLKKIIDEFPYEHHLKRFKGNLYYERKPLVDLFSTIKQEGWSVENIIAEAELYMASLENDPDYKYKRKSGNNVKGDTNWGKVKTEQNKFKKLIAAALEFKKYNALMNSAERYDFQDMILWVIERFSEKPELLVQYQERYQYFLVDEYQDTNGSQNVLLDLLASYWEDPNLFVVGDDDQSIFRFQGANMNNIVLFKEKYNPKVIVLENNYRSSQEILDSATLLVNYNQERLVNQYKGEFHKNLIESRTQEHSNHIKPIINVYQNTTQEEIGIASEIVRLQKAGENLSEVAIIYRSHANVDNIVKYLELKNVPLNIKKRLNILHTPEILRIINILEFIEKEGRFIDSSFDLLFELLHFEYFGLRARDIGLISLHCSRKKGENEEEITWATALQNKTILQKIGVSDPEKLMNIYDKLQQWISDSKNLTLQVLFEKIITEGNIIDTIMYSSDKVWRLQLLNTFFDFIKNESVKKPDMSLSDLLEFIQLMNDNDITLPYEKIISNVEGVNFITAHSAKGLEFKYVYILRCESTNWESKRPNNNKFVFPPGLVPISEMSGIEDDRRLFFVAMTRAKDHLVMSYPAQNDNEKSLEPSRFLTEIEYPENFVNVNIDAETIVEYKADLLRYSNGIVELIDNNLIAKVLENYSLSVTSLNKYLKCPLTFYFENILKVPLARNANMGFGKAMHYAMEQCFIKIDEVPERQIPSIEKVISFFEKGMNKTKSHYTSKEFADLTVYGKKCLSEYYKEYSNQWLKPLYYKMEYKVDLTQFQGVPIKGVLDKVAIFHDHVEVTDYKTGSFKYASPKMKPPVSDEDIGGDYWRQIVFYQILLNSDPRMEKPMKKGIMDFLEPEDEENFKKREFEIADFEIEIVADQLKSVYQKINEKEFSQGCNKDDCKWCNFVNNHFKLESTFESFEDEER